MTEKLDRIKSVLNKVIKDGKKVDTENITGAISELENFPMTKALLQSTRVGKVLNEVRKLTSGTLPNRIKTIIKAWQVLAQTASKPDTIVIPAKTQNGISSNCPSPATNCFSIDNTVCPKGKLRRVNGSTASLPVLESLVQDGSYNVGSPSSPALSSVSNSADRNNHIQKRKDTPHQSVKKRTHCSNQNALSDANSSTFDTDSYSPPNKCLRLQSVESSAAAHTSGNNVDSPSVSKTDTGKTSSTYLTSENKSGNSIAIPKLRIRLSGNGKNASSVVANLPSKALDSSGSVPVLSPSLTSSTAKNFQFSKDEPNADALSVVSGSTNRSSRQQPVTNPALLPRVKSTAELLTQYGTDIKGKKKANILEIEREPDLVPSVLPESARPRRLRTNLASSSRNKQSGSTPSAPGTSQDLLVIDTPAAFKKGKSSILEKFLASAVKYSDNDESDKDVSQTNETATYAVTSFVVNSAASSAPVTSPPMSVPSHQVSPASTSKPVLSSPKTKFDSTNVDADAKMEDSETVNESATDVETKRKHHKHRHKNKHKVKNKHKANVSHPVTNLMDRRPVPLPQLPDVNPASYPYPLPKPAEVSEGAVDRLLHRTWKGVNCISHGDTGESVPLTDMYSLGLHNAANNPDSVLHMLPWVDLNGWQRQYFPENALKYIDEFQLAKPR